MSNIYSEYLIHNHSFLADLFARNIPKACNSDRGTPAYSEYVFADLLPITKHYSWFLVTMTVFMGEGSVIRPFRLTV